MTVTSANANSGSKIHQTMPGVACSSLLVHVGPAQDSLRQLRATQDSSGQLRALQPLSRQLRAFHFDADHGCLDHATPARPGAVLSQP